MKAVSISPILIVEDVNDSVEFYTEVLGFDYAMGVDNNKELYLKYEKNKSLGFAIVQNGGVQIMMQELENAKNDGFDNLAIDKDITNATIYIEVEGLDEFYTKVKEEVKIVNDMRNTFYGMKEFYISDNSGNIVGFAEKLI